MRTGKWTHWILAGIALFALPSITHADPDEGEAPAVFRAPALEPKLLESLTDIFLGFDVIRVVSSHPANTIAHRTRADAYNTYVDKLGNYGLVPQSELSCLFTLAPPQDVPRDEAMRAEQLSAPIRQPSTRFVETDPCYPIKGKPMLDRPWGWNFDDSERGGSNGDGTEGRGAGTSEGRGEGGNGGGVGRGR